MADVITIMAQTGLENYSRGVITKALNMYLPTTPGFDKDVLSSLDTLSDGDFYLKVNELCGDTNEIEAAESLLLTEAFKRAESKLKSQLKNPRSYKRDSIMGSQIAYDPNTGNYNAVIIITYTATNSFGGAIQDKFSYTESGTYIDGRIQYKEN